MQQKGFTLIELLIVIAIIAVLSVVVVLTLNPAELLRRARDSTRISDMSSLNSALNNYRTDGGTDVRLYEVGNQMSL
ncbi:MAG: prepilin-type N-terminal cleavage/methylation domain-containing protein [Patescibacteria group bacterium]